MMSINKSNWALSIVVLLCCVAGLQLTIMQGVVLGSVLGSTPLFSGSSQTAFAEIEKENSVELLTIFSFLASQIFVANTAWVFPTLPFLRLNPSVRFTKLEVFDRKYIGTHMYYGISFASGRNEGPDGEDCRDV
jgi:hypothetical protein